MPRHSQVSGRMSAHGVEKDMDVEDGDDDLQNAQKTSTPILEENRDTRENIYTEENGKSNEKEKRAKKRKNDESLNLDESFSEDQVDEMKEAVKKINKNISDVYKKVFGYSKVRNDIKDQMKELQRLNKLLLEETVLRILEQGKKIPTADHKSNDVGKEDIPEKSEDLTKRYYCDRCSIAIERLEEEKQEIIEGIKKGQGIEDDEYLRILGKKWPKEVYTSTKLVAGNPLTAKCEELIIFYGDRKEESTLLKITKEKFTNVEEILEEEEEDDEDIPFIENIVNTKKGSSKTRILFCKIGDGLELKRKLTDLRTQITDRNVKELAVAVSLTEKREYLRKVTELCFVGMAMEIEFYVPRNEIAVKKKERNEAIVIGTDVSTYAETLKNIRAVVNPEDLGIGIKTVKTTRDHRVIIETEEGKAEELHREITSKVKGLDMRVTGKSSNTITILDIDASMTGKEVEDRIRNTTKTYETLVKTIRMGRGGTQIATVVMPKEAAEKLISDGDIKIGWTRCRVKAKVELLRCYNCLKFGHHSDICKEDRSEKRCMKCTRTGHLIRDCVNPSFCATCEKSGHRTDSNICPTFRRIYQDATAQNRHTEEIAIDTEEMETEDVMGNKPGGNENNENDNDVTMITTPGGAETGGPK